MSGNSISIGSFAVKPVRAAKEKFKSSPYVSTRIQRWGFYWLAVLLASGCFLALLAVSEKAGFAGLLIASFALQAAITEFRGVRVEASFICIPLRPLPRLPMITFWCKRIALSEVSTITVKPAFFGVERV
ncbi:MAG: hypothetical protein WB816_02770, partial [Methylocystis sp.]